MLHPARTSPLIGVVGVCASGKTSLIKRLKECGFSCRHIAQEHSYVADMWQKITRPDFLIFLEVSYPNTILRRSLNWTQDEYNEQIYRLRHAYAHANLIINTNEIPEPEVFKVVITSLAKVGMFPSPFNPDESHQSAHIL